MPYPLGESVYSPYGPVATFLVKGVQPPAAQYIGPSDQLQLTVLSPNVAVTLMLGLRLLDLLGQVSPLSYKIDVPATGATPFVKVITPGECFLLSAIVGQANVRRGQSYATLLLQRGQPTGGAAVGDVLISGYPSSTDTLGFPQTPAMSSTDGRGASLVYKSPVPAAGSPAIITVPPGTRWRLQDAIVLLSSGGGFGTAIYPILYVTTPGGDHKVAAETVTTYTAIGNSLIKFNNAGFGWLPIALDLNAGDVISADVFPAFPVGASYGALSVNVEEFAEL